MLVTDVILPLSGWFEYGEMNMKKFLLLAFLSFFALNVHAHGEQWLGFGVLAKKAKWSPVQFSIWPVHLCNPRAEIYGVLLSPGIFGFADKVYGVSCGTIVMMAENNGLAANIYSYGMKNNGLAVGLFNTWQRNNCVSIGLANFIHDKKDGGNTIQIGVFNQANSGLQIGLLNYNPNALIPWMPLINWVSPRSVESSLKELCQRPYPFDDHITKHANQYFPNWNQQQRLHWLNELFPLTDAGATYALMEAAKKHGMLQKWDQYALTLSEKQRKRLRYSLGSWIAQQEWYHIVETTPDGSLVLKVFKIGGAIYTFSVKFKELPPREKIKVSWQNSDLVTWYERKTENVNANPFVELFTIRHDAETGIWFETGSWKEVRQKVPAVTTCKVDRDGITLYQIKGDKWIYKEFRLKEQYRKIKLGSLEPEHIIQKTVK